MRDEEDHNFPKHSNTKTHSLFLGDRMKEIKTKVLIGVTLLLMAFFLMSCGAEVETAIESEQQEQTETTEESVALEETVVVETSDTSTSVDVTSESVDVSVDVSTDAVSVDLEQNDEETQTNDESTEIGVTDVEVKIENYVFEEKTLTLKAGTTVIWENYDSAPHTVTGDGLDSGKMSKGDIYEYTFTEPGTYEYYCAYHPSMTAKVIVE